MFLSQLNRKIPRVAWSFVDQGVVSAGNFLLNLALARILAPRLYGNFAIFYLAMLGANTFQSSVVTYWINIKGAATDRAGTRKLTTGALGITTSWLIPMSVLILIACSMVHTFSLFLPATIALYSWQLQEAARRGLLCQMRYEAAVLPDAVSYLGQAAFVFMFRPSNLFSVFVILGATSLVALAWQMWIVKCTSITRGQLKADLKESLHLGRYVAVANGINVFLLQIPAWALLRSSGADAVAAFQALSNVINASNPLLFGISNHLISVVARAAKTSLSAARSVVARDGTLTGIILLLYLLVIAAKPALLISVIYGHESKYLASASLLRILAMTFFAYFISTIVSAYEVGLGRTTSYMNSQTVALVVTCLVGIPIIYKWGLWGAAVASLLVASSRSVTIIILSYLTDRSSSIRGRRVNSNVTNRSLSADSQ